MLEDNLRASVAVGVYAMSPAFAGDRTGVEHGKLLPFRLSGCGST